jgi:hypothetical protein
MTPHCSFLSALLLPYVLLSKFKQFSGADIMRGQGDNMIFNAAWSFQVSHDTRPE